LGRHKLDVVNEEKDLGVHFINNLKPSEHIQKSEKVLGMIGSTIYYNDSDLLVRWYKSPLQLHFEYCVSAWSSVNQSIYFHKVVRQQNSGAVEDFIITVFGSLNANLKCERIIEIGPHLPKLS